MDTQALTEATIAIHTASEAPESDDLARFDTTVDYLAADLGRKALRSPHAIRSLLHLQAAREEFARAFDPRSDEEKLRAQLEARQALRAAMEPEAEPSPETPVIPDEESPDETEVIEAHEIERRRFPPTETGEAAAE